VLSDDIVPIWQCDDRFFATPALPYLSLWPDSVAMLYGSEKKLPRFSPGYEKTQLSLEGGSCLFQESALPLGTIFILDERSSGPDAPAVEDLTPRERLLALVTHSYAGRTLDKQMRAQEFRLFGRMQGRIPIQRLRPHSDPRRIDELCDVIESSCAVARPA
jgi:hypothetical protein